MFWWRKPRTSCYRWIAWGMCQEALDLERSNGGERTESKCRKDEDHDLLYRPGPPAEFRRVSMRCLSHWSGQQQHLLQRLQALGAKEMQWAQVLDKGPWIQMYMVPGNCTPLGRQTTEGSPSLTWQAGGDNFLLLPCRHALSSWWLWTLNHNTCENHLEEVQGAAISSLFPPPLFQDTWPRVQLLCVERNAPCQWDLAIDNSNLQRLQRNNRAMIEKICNVKQQDIVTTRSNKLLAQLGIEDLDLILKERRLRYYGHKTLQWCSQDSLWPTGWWKVWAWEAQDDMEAADREGLQRVEALVYRPSWKHTWRSGVRSAMHAASQLPGRGPTDVDVAPVPAC